MWSHNINEKRGLRPSFFIGNNSLVRIGKLTKETIGCGTTKNFGSTKVRQIQAYVQLKCIPGTFIDLKMMIDDTMVGYATLYNPLTWDVTIGYTFDIIAECQNVKFSFYTYQGTVTADSVKMMYSI